MAFTAESPLFSNIITAVLLLYILWTRFPPPDLCLYKRRKFSVHGTVSYVVFQNIPGYDVLLLYILWTGFYPPDLRLSMCKEFIVHGTISYVVFQNIVITTVL